MDKKEYVKMKMRFIQIQDWDQSMFKNYIDKNPHMKSEFSKILLYEERTDILSSLDDENIYLELYNNLDFYNLTKEEQYKCLLEHGLYIYKLDDDVVDMLTKEDVIKIVQGVTFKMYFKALNVVDSLEITFINNYRKIYKKFGIKMEYAIREQIELTQLKTCWDIAVGKFRRSISEYPIKHLIKKEYPIEDIKVFEEIIMELYEKRDTVGIPTVVTGMMLKSLESAKRTDLDIYYVCKKIYGSLVYEYLSQLTLAC